MERRCPHAIAASLAAPGWRRAALAVALALAAAGVGAQTPTTAIVAQPQNVLHLSATASVEVPRDWLSVAFSTTREGPDAVAVQNQLKQALDAALAEARRIARPGDVEVQTGNFSLYPRTQPNRGITGWQGTAELVVEGRDAQAISQLTGRIQTMTVARVGWSISRQAREKVEGEVAALAAERFRAKAENAARLFGFSSYSLREVTLVTDSPMGGFMPMARVSAAMAPADALPVEAGRGTVQATVSGSVQLSAR